MAKQFSKSKSSKQLNLAMANVQLDENTIAQPDAVQITSWLSRLHLLYGIPFNYLVPDIRMLPDESIRFFQVDENWITALIDGAYSLGTTAATSSVSQALQPQIQAYVNENLSSVRAGMLGLDFEQTASANLSGFFLRSAAVSGWPGMEVTGYGNEDAPHPLTILRMERISPSLLLCLFNGIVTKVEMQLPAEAICFDVDFSGIENEYKYGEPYFNKMIRYVNSYGGVVAGGTPIGSHSGNTVHVTPERCARMNDLAFAIQNGSWAPGTPAEDQKLTSAEFALGLVQNTEIITFQINSQND